MSNKKIGKIPTEKQLDNLKKEDIKAKKCLLLKIKEKLMKNILE